MSGSAAAPSTTDLSKTVSQDYEDREFVEVIQLNISKIVSFLNEFDLSARYRLARINEKLTSLERKLQYADAAIRNSNE